MGRSLIITVLIIHFKLVIAQNLISNSSFEDYYDCPNSSRGFNVTPHKKILPFWINPNKGTVDYFNKCSRVKSGVPRNWAGISNAKSGNAYVGIVISGSSMVKGAKTYREYIQTKLINPLEADSLYCVKLYVKHASYSLKRANSIGLYISKKKLKGKKAEAFFVKPQISLDSYMFPTDSVWTEICGIYKAQNKERFITIGNFDLEEDTKYETVSREVPHREKSQKSAYYYLDAVSVEKVSNEKKCHCEEKSVFAADSLNEKPTFDQDKTVTLPDFTFKTNQWQLENKNNSLLDSLADYLLINKNYKITIEGHTDNVGKESANIELSVRRAETIRQYLMSKGVEKIRMTIKGYGSTKPVESNKKEGGKAKNRRVEIQIVNENE